MRFRLWRDDRRAGVWTSPHGKVCCAGTAATPTPYAAVQHDSPQAECAQGQASPAMHLPSCMRAAARQTLSAARMAGVGPRGGTAAASCQDKST